MQVLNRESIEARIAEIDEFLLSRKACEMTEGWLSCGPDTIELEDLYRERAALVRQLSEAA